MMIPALEEARSATFCRGVLRFGIAGRFRFESFTRVSLGTPGPISRSS
jgi:hypothetical protein